MFHSLLTTIPIKPNHNVVVFFPSGFMFHQASTTNLNKFIQEAQNCSEKRKREKKTLSWIPN